jgi:hypothetical protein
MPRLAPTVLALCSLAASACIAPDRPPGLVLASEPPGARILVDGNDSGWVTPMALHLDRGDRTRVDLVLEGYRPATMVVEPGGQAWYVILWRESYKDWDTWRFPIWLNYEDFLAPVKVTRSLQPSRIFVPLRLAPLQ